MAEVAVYITDEDGLAVVYVSQNALEERTILEIVTESVPMGKMFLIMEEAGLPSDLSYASAWTIDEALLVSGVGSFDPDFVPEPVAEVVPEIIDLQEGVGE